MSIRKVGFYSMRPLGKNSETISVTVKISSKIGFFFAIGFMKGYVGKF